MNQEIKLEELDGLLSDKKVFLVCGKSFDGLSIKENIEKACNEIVRFSDFSPNPVYEDVCKGVKLFHKEQCNAILAVGGGSAMDVAKCIKLFAPMDGQKNYLDQEITESDILFIAIPTTAGSGSESSKHVVIYYQNQKQSISHENALPDYYILEPSTLQKLPLYQKKCTLLDALCQAIESWWSVNSTAESIGYSKKAIRLITENWKEYIEHNTIDSALQILRASNYSGKAINITSTTAAHAMSYKITTTFGLPHGHAVAICMPYVWEYLKNHMDRCIDTRGEDYLRKTLDGIQELIDPEYYNNLLDELAMEYPVSGNKPKEAELLAKSVNTDRLKNYPVSLTENDLRDMYGVIIKEDLL